MSRKKHWEELFSVTQLEVLIVEPRTDSSVVEALEALRQRKVVVVKLEYLTPQKQQRVADWLAGCACAIDGQTRWLEQHTLLCTPPGVDVIAKRPP
ncbi:MAG: cell division protein SepF [Cyanophyceae cyanobacterium]